MVFWLELHDRPKRVFFQFNELGNFNKCVHGYQMINSAEIESCFRGFRETAVLATLIPEAPTSCN